jgi:hypothetical protein
MISKSTGTVCADESSLQLWRQSGWWFVSRQLLDFQWWFQSQVGMCAPMNPHVRCRRSFIDDFWFSNDSVFGDDFASQHGMWALTNPGVSYAGSLVDYFWVVSYSVFDDNFRVNMDCVRRQIQASTREAVSVMISKSVATQFSMKISESTSVVWADESTSYLWKQFHWQFLSWQRLSFWWWFPSKLGLCVLTNSGFSCGGSLVVYFRVGNDSVFSDDFPVNWNCVRCPIQASGVEAVSVTILES